MVEVLLLKNTLLVKAVESRLPPKNMTGPKEKIKQVRMCVVFYLVTGKSSEIPPKSLLQPVAGDSSLKAQTLFYGSIRA